MFSTATGDLFLLIRLLHMKSCLATYESEFGMDVNNNCYLKFLVEEVVVDRWNCSEDDYYWCTLPVCKKLSGSLKWGRCGVQMFHRYTHTKYVRGNGIFMLSADGWNHVKLLAVVVLFRPNAIIIFSQNKLKISIGLEIYMAETRPKTLSHETEAAINFQMSDEPTHRSWDWDISYS